MASQLLLLAAVVVMVTETVRATKPWYCQSYDCPSFTSQETANYEIRNYAESHWVATSIVTGSSDPGRSERSSMFRSLFRYISGDNSRKQKIEMTVPVLTKVEKRPTDYQITMMFYLPFSNAPTPDNPDVFLVTKPAGNVYVKSFPSRWWFQNRRYVSEMESLKTALENSQIAFVDNAYYKAGYNSPMDFWKYKQHEVWMDSQ